MTKVCTFATTYAGVMRHVNLDARPNSTSAPLSHLRNLHEVGSQT